MKRGPLRRIPSPRHARATERHWWQGLLLTLTLLVVACGQSQQSAARNDGRDAGRDAGRNARNPVILISIDGFRPDYLQISDPKNPRAPVTPVLNALARSGVFAPMRPSFPSLTFPNHYTLVTGLRPDHHGLIGNTMEDPRRPGQRFRLSERAMVTDAFWWDGGEPVWVTAEKRGVPTATLFWPGSEAPIHGQRPGRWLEFDSKISPRARVTRLLQWFDEPRPPAFATLYFDDVDHEGHEFGPSAPEVVTALAQVDRAIGELLAGLRSRGIAANLLIVSDHGMARVGDGNAIYLNRILPERDFRLVSAGAYAGIVPGRGAERRVVAALTGGTKAGKFAHMQCWTRDHIPARFAYGKNRRVPPILCLADPGWMIALNDAPDKEHPEKGPPRGMHGYDNRAPDMMALFIANGPAFRDGVTLKPFDNVDVYPLVMRLIGVAPLPSDGTIAPLLPALAGTIKPGRSTPD